jgi:hypothetical protein
LARVYNINIDQGSKFQLSVQILNDDGTVRDLTGYVARMSIRKYRGAVASLLDLTSPSSGLTITPLAGTITINMTDEQTESLSIRSGVYDLKIESGGLEERVIQGGVALSPQVTS